MREEATRNGDGREAESKSGLLEFDPLWDYNDPAGTEERFRDLLPAAWASGDQAYLAELLTQIARTEGLQRRFDAAHRTLDEVDDLLPVAGDRATIRCLLERGRVFNSSRRPEQARQLFLRAWQLAENGGEDFYAIDAAHMMAIVEPPEGQLEWQRAALELAERSADPRARGWLGSLYNNLGWTYHDLGKLAEALAVFQQGLEWQQQAGKAREARIAAWTVGRTLRSLGRHEEALEMQRENLQQIAGTGDSDGYIQEELGECLLALGRNDEAREHFRRAFAALSEDPWLMESEPARVARLGRLGGVPDRDSESAG